LPFWHTTVVVLPGGTTTVVFWGGAGLELLMHPANIPAAIIALNNTFIVDSCASIAAFIVIGAGQRRQGRTSPLPVARAPTHSSPRHTVVRVPRYWIYGRCSGAYSARMPRRFIDSKPLKGRGASSNPAGRFDSVTLERTDDGWYQEETPDFLAETVLPDRARGIISTNDSPDVGFEQSINPYRGCSHGCVYCFARPSHAFLGLSPGLDFETKLFYKADAVKILEQELGKPRYVCKPIALGINTDGYQPLEKKLEVTRSILAVLARCRHPVTIVTKSALVLRDLDLLADLAADRLASVMISITSLTDDIKRTLEPRTASPQARLRVVRQLSEAGIPVGVLVAPVIPALTDHEMEDILAAARAAGASSAGYVLLRLPHELKVIFREWLEDHYPDRAAHIMSLINQARGGKDYDSQFGTRMKGTGAYAELLRARFDLAVRKLGLESADERYDLDTSKFRQPGPVGAQLTLGL
jgi:DNA repair photolyase